MFTDKWILSNSLLKIKVKTTNNMKRRYSPKSWKTKLNRIKYVSVMVLSITKMNCSEKKLKVCFHPMLLDFQKNTACCRLPGFDHISFWYEKHGDEDENGALVGSFTAENGSTWRKTYPSVIFCITNFTWDDLGSNPVLHGDRLQNNRFLTMLYWDKISYIMSVPLLT